MAVLKDIEAAGEAGKLLDSSVENLTAWLSGGFLPDWAQGSIEELVKDEAWDELNDRFYQYLAFGTGGMRGRTIGNVVSSEEKGAPSEKGTPAHPAVGSAYLNDFNIVRATLGLYRYCEKYLSENSTKFEAPKLVIAHDVRHFSRHFCDLTASVWTQLGGRALIFDGPRSTPQLSFTVRHVGATAGIVITASHNPPHDNGYKVYFNDGAQVVSPQAEGIVKEVGAVDLKDLAAFLEVKKEGVVTLPASVDDAYLEVLEDNVIDAEMLRRAKPKVVFTPIHGTGGISSLPLMKHYGVEVVPVDEQMKQDPRFPTVKSPNPENAEALELGINKALESEAELIMGTDPDCDRMGVAVRTPEGKMQLLTGNMIGSVLAEYRINKLKELGWIPQEGTQNATLIKTFVTTPLQAAIAEAHGLKIIDTLTGFKFIGEKLKDYEDRLKAKLLKEGIALDYDHTAHRTRAELLLKHSTFYVFGGEESYGYLASDRLRDKDANAAVIMFCELAAALKEEGKTFTEYLDGIYLKYGYYLEQLLNLVYEGATGSAKIKNILQSYRNDPPKGMGGCAVTQFTDFGTQTVHDADGKEIPKQDFYVLELDNGYSYAVRGSGTEPKIKYYLFAREEVESADTLPDVKAKTQETLDALKGAIEADARSRAES